MLLNLVSGARIWLVGC